MKAYSMTAVAAMIGALSGCMSDPKFACPGPGAGVTCASAIEVYNMSITGNRPGDKITGTGKGKGIVLESVPDDARTPTKPLQQPLPMLAPAEVLRIWINQYKDAKGDLFFPGFILTEVTPRTWIIGEEVTRTARVLTPLQIEEPAKEKSTDPGGTQQK